MDSIDLQINKGDAIIIVPPFAGLDKPSIGVHILQSCAREAGFEVSIFYSNFLFANFIGEEVYQSICYNSAPTGVGERIFTSAAYGFPLSDGSGSEDRVKDTGLALRLDCESIDSCSKIEKLSPHNLEVAAIRWADVVSDAIIRKKFRVVGCTTTFEQTAPGIALFKRIKRANPEVTTVLGGANCQGEMGEGLLSLTDSIDYIFSGESEIPFPSFLNDVLAGRLPKNRVIPGKITVDMDTIPTPDYSEYYDQFKLRPSDSIIPDKDIWMPYESSRGCWWGQKHQCTFCGITGEIIKFREKSADRVIYELREMLKKHPNRNISMADSNMPYKYFKDLIPRLGKELPGLRIFYELKANLSLAKMVALKNAGIVAIQPGIESLSTSCLKLMNKGVSARQNIALLRYARSVDISVGWNVLYGIPGDRIEEYQHMLDLMPLLHHLHPPIGLSYISIERFSPYFSHPCKYNISNIRPMDFYSSILPRDVDISRIAYHFFADYRSESRYNPDLMQRFAEEIKRWRNSWRQGVVPPVLAVTDIGNGHYLLIDTRGLPGTQELNFITEDQTSIALAGANSRYGAEVEWALERKLIVELDTRYIPLATAQAELLMKFEGARGAMMI